MLSTWHMGALSSDRSTAYLSLVSISKQNLLSMDSVFLLTQYFRVKSKVPWYKRGLIGSLNKNVQKLLLPPAVSSVSFGRHLSGRQEQCVASQRTLSLQTVVAARWQMVSPCSKNQ